ncbi:MAG: hypothetical protein MUE59_06120 [Thiobacillaceae bacterium]|nr:hypothetical protein [Thiobacillaceae bacterium]
MSHEQPGIGLGWSGSNSAKAVIDDMVHERQQHFVLPSFVHFWRKSWTDESERPLIENRYSPFRLQIQPIDATDWANRSAGVS